ncbi:hypothetical protein [Vibrio phage vB_VpS_PG28]|nr:hypothetical protein [Vibrio phage vB_VpS_PG28]
MEYTNPHNLPEDTDDLLALFSEELNVTPESASRGKLHHLAFLISKNLTENGGGVPKSTPVPLLARVYSADYQNSMDLNQWFSSEGTLQGRHFHNHDGATTVAALGQNYYGYIRHITVEGDTLTYMSKIEDHDSLDIQFAETLTGFEGYKPLVDIGTGDNDMGNGVPFILYKPNTTDNTVALQFFGSDGNLDNTVNIPAQAVRPALDSGKVYHMAVNLSGEFTLYLVHDFVSKNVDVVYASATGNPAWQGKFEFSADKPILATSASLNYNVSAALLSEFGQSDNHQLIWVNDTTLTMSDVAANLGFSSGEDNISMQLMGSHSTPSSLYALVLGVGEDRWSRSEGYSENATLSRVGMTDNTNDFTVKLSRKVLDPELKYGMPFLTKLNLVGRTYLALPRLDGSGIDCFSIYDLAEIQNLDTSKVDIAIPTTADMRTAMTEDPKNVVRAFVTTQGIGYMTLGRSGTAQGTHREVRCVMLPNGTNTIKAIRSPEMDYPEGADAGVVGGLECYVDTVAFPQPNSPSVIPYLGNGSPEALVVLEPVSGALFVDHQAVFLPSNAPVGTKYLLLRQKELGSFTRVYYSYNEVQLGTVVCELDSETGQGVTQKVIGYIGMSSNHPQYSGALAVERTVDGWKATNLI